MELIVIDVDRMKIMLSGEEMSSYCIDAMTIDTDDEDTKRILYDIIDRARRSAGLSCEYGRMFVRVFPSSDGGCEMYVTRYSELFDEEESRDMQQGNTVPRRRRHIYATSSIESLARIGRALEAKGYSGVSDVYISDGEDVYYLVLSEDEADLSVVCEYAEPVGLSGMLSYLSEHARILCERDAVARFSALFRITEK